MSDVAFVGIILLFFALAVLFVRICDHLIGVDEETVGEVHTEVDVTKVAA